MNLYLFRFGYSVDAWAAMMANPQDRRELLASRIFADFGGRLSGFWYAFGEHDGYALVELPDNVSAAAAAVAVMSTGSFRSFDTIVLLTADEMVEAVKRANDFAYVKPGAASEPTTA